MRLLRLRLLRLGPLLPRLPTLNRCTKDVKPAGGAGLLSLEPGPQAGLVEDVVAGQLLGGGSKHLLAADDADVVGVGELLGSCIRIPIEERVQLCQA